MVVDLKNKILSVGHHSGHLRELEHNVKTSRDAIFEAGRMLAKFVTRKNILIPIPGHQGDANYTYDICKTISVLTGATVLDALQGFERESSHEAKLNGKSIKRKIWFFTVPGVEIPHQNVILVDNCYATGHTATAARKALGYDNAVVLTITNAQK